MSRKKIPAGTIRGCFKLIKTQQKPTLNGRKRTYFKLLCLNCGTIQTKSNFRPNKWCALCPEDFYSEKYKKNRKKIIGISIRLGARFADLKRVKQKYYRSRNEEIEAVMKQYM